MPKFSAATRHVLLLSLCHGAWLTPLAHAQNAPSASGPATSPAIAAPAGSPSFCPFEVPLDDATKRRWINLAHVQYVDASGADVRIYYGGGNFGAGHEERIPVINAQEALSLVDRMRRSASACVGARN